MKKMHVFIKCSAIVLCIASISLIATGCLRRDWDEEYPTRPKPTFPTEYYEDYTNFIPLPTEVGTRTTEYPTEPTSEKPTKPKTEPSTESSSTYHYEPATDSEGRIILPYVPRTK